jgi:hypothetical protein
MMSAFERTISVAVNSPRESSMWMGKRLEVRRHFSIAVEVVGEEEKLIRDRITKNKLRQHHPSYIEFFSCDRNVGILQHANCKIEREPDKDYSDAEKTKHEYFEKK